MTGDTVYVHPDALPMIERARQAPELAVETMTPAALREIVDGRVANAPLEKPTLAQVVDRAIPGPAGQLPLRLYRPSSAAGLPWCMFFHGGGFMLGNLQTHDALCRQLAEHSGAAVVAVDFRLSPENTFPAAHDDCLAATRWVLDHATELGLHATRFAVGGESSGGNLAASTALRLVAQQAPVPALQLLLYPLVDMSFDSASYRQFGTGYLLTEQRMRFYLRSYLAGADPANPVASPLRSVSLAGAPPTYLLTASLDPTRDHSEAYAARLRDAGIPVQHDVFEGWPHGFLFWGHAEGSGTAIAAACKALRDALRTV